jgi:prepilin-type processing-associated H-X9-DG protein
MPSFQMLCDAGMITDLTMFVCPASGKTPGDPSKIDEWTDYVLLPIPADADPSACAIAYCRCGHDGNGNTNILYGDGHVEWGRVPRQPKADGAIKATGQ